MRKTTKLEIAIILVLMLCSCGRHLYHSQTEPRDVPNVDSFKLNAAGPIALKNASVTAPGIEENLCNFGRIDVLGNLNSFSESAIGTAKNALQRKGIAVDDKANKKLELSVYKANCEKGWMFTSSTFLSVRTGNGLTREYQGLDSHATWWQTTAGFENAMVQCIEQMLKDEDIVSYLEK